MAITWQQVAAPDLTDVSRILGQGAANAGAGLTSIAKAFDPIRDAAKVRKAELTELNTLDEIQKINSIKDVNQLDSYLSGLNANTLTARRGDAVDLSKVLSTAASAKTNLQNTIGVDQKFAEDQLVRTENPAYLDFKEKITAATSNEDLDALAQNAAALKSKYGAELVALADSRKKQLLSESQSKEDRAQTIKERARTNKLNEESDIDLANNLSRSAYFATGLNDVINNAGDLSDNQTQEDILNNLTSKSWFNRLPPEQQAADIQAVKDRFGLNSINLTSKEKETLLNTQAADAKAIEESFMSTKQSIDKESEKLAEQDSLYNSPNAAQGIVGWTSELVSNMKGAETSGFLGFGTAHESINQEDVINLTNSANEGVDLAKAELKTTLLANPEYLAAKGIKAGTEYKDLSAQQQTELEAEVGERLNPKVIYAALKQTTLEDPTGLGKISLDVDSFKDRALAAANNYKMYTKEKTRLKQSLYDAEVTKRDQELEAATKLKELMSNAAKNR